MSASSDLRSLFANYARGKITAEQLEVLEDALREDSNLRREFTEYMNIDSALGHLAALSEAEVAEIEGLKSDELSAYTTLTLAAFWISAINPASQ